MLRVDDSRVALSSVAASWFGFPANDMKIVGITGTNGKTTTATMLYETFEDLGYVCGLFSTVKILIHGNEYTATHTTPDPIAIHSIMAQMRDAGCEFCFMEVSSHSIHQNRILDIPFKVAVFSNITQDHLDYHKTFKEYIYAKKTLFDNLDSSAIAIYNSDDRNGNVMVQNSSAKQVSYGLKNMADYNAKIIEKHFDGMLLNINGKDVWTNLTGDFNAYNLLAVYVAAIQLYPNNDEVLEVLSKRNPVRGRFELVENAKGIHVIIDYAHTPDAVQNVLEAIRDLRTNNERVITVIGAGGNRDKTKRPIMAKKACLMSEVVIFTSDNPRFEKPEDIIEDMKKGIPSEFAGQELTVVNREEAIKVACAMANKDDVVLIAGKGHETYQEIVVNYLNKL